MIWVPQATASCWILGGDLGNSSWVGWVEGDSQILNDFVAYALPLQETLIEVFIHSSLNHF